jgi:hypothetical protein
MISIDLIKEERKRQITERKYDDKHDDDHDHDELIQAAQCYLDHVSIKSHVMNLNDSYDEKIKLYKDVKRPKNWPPQFDKDSWNPDSPIRDLVKAAALIAAEIDRRLRIPNNFYLKRIDG